jgi:hypothetical protein
VAFKELPWGSTTPVTTGFQYTISYDPNGATGGTVPANYTGPFGSSYTVLGNTGSLTRTGTCVLRGFVGGEQPVPAAKKIIFWVGSIFLG